MNQAQPCEPCSSEFPVTTDTVTKHTWSTPRSSIEHIAGYTVTTCAMAARSRNLSFGLLRSLTSGMMSQEN